MNILQSAFAGASWLAFFRIISQTFSWITTIIIARILVPEDYGMMEMATIFTGYVVLFSEIGLGSAIVQRDEITEDELSSIFWFVVGWGFLLSLSCLVIAYPTAAVFHNESLIPLTQSVAVIFMLGALIIVPQNILLRNLKFKLIGLIEATSVIISCVSMIIMASLGSGVWTLIGGNIVKTACRAVLVMSFSEWRPRFSFGFDRLKPYLQYGINVAVGNTFYYIYMKSDRFFAGRMLGASKLGYYSMALQLSVIPTDKVISLINRVSFPLFSRCQNDPKTFNDFFLKMVKILGIISLPLYCGGIFIADELILALLGTKWIDAIIPFKMLCVAQIFVALASVNAIVYNAKGLPRVNVYFNLANVILLPLSFFIAARYGLIYVAIPWITIHPLIRIVQTWMTLRLLALRISSYLKAISHPVYAVLSMMVVLISFRSVYFAALEPQKGVNVVYIIATLVLGAASYVGYYALFQRNVISVLWGLLTRRERPVLQSEPKMEA